ncbi:MAG: Mur ligase family protein [Halofilum sp. (in: g-proteobacteria)]
MSGHGTQDDALSAGWDWLSTLPRTATAHAARGDDPLAATRGLLAALGDPHERLRTIHIVGSKGKGSTALFTESLMLRLGWRVFTFTSPHLERWTERLRIDGEEADATAALASLEAVREASETTGIVPGFFEALTVAGFDFAVRQGAEWAVIEAGVGGRADATNVVQPAVAILTGIELEHTDRLGTTLEEIAAEKTGAIKPGVPVVAPRLPKGPEAILRAAVERAQSEWVAIHRSPQPARAPRADRRIAWHFAPPTLTIAGPGWSVQTELTAVGAVMGQNATLAIAAIARLGLVTAEQLQEAARGLAETALPGRLETVSTLPWVVVDSAHTPTSAQALTETVSELEASRIHLLLSLSTSKDIDRVIGALMPGVDAVTTTCADPDYSLSAEEVATAVRRRRPYLPVESIDDPERALAVACKDGPGETLVIATGSVYLAGRVRAAFGAGSGPNAPHD